LVIYDGEIRASVDFQKGYGYVSLYRRDSQKFQPLPQVPHRRRVNNLKIKLEQYRRTLVVQVDANARPYSRFLMEPERVNALRQTVSSYFGHFKHADAFHLLQALWNRHSWLAE